MDIRDTIEIQEKGLTAILQNGPIQYSVPDETYEELKKFLRKEFPHITETTANEIIFKLSRNFLKAIKKLDEIIKRSKKFQRARFLN